MALIPRIRWTELDSGYHSTDEYLTHDELRRTDDIFDKICDQSFLEELLKKYIKTSDRVLTINRGNSATSRFTDRLHTLGIRNTTKVNLEEFNLSEEQLCSAKASQFVEPDAISLDALNMGLASDSFSAVLDTGILEAITENKLDNIFTELCRVMKFGGRYICFTVAEKLLLSRVLDYFPKEGWIVRVHMMDNSSTENTMPVFVFVLTKFKKLPKSTPILEVDVEGSHELRRLQDREAVTNAILENQQYAIFRQKINRPGSVEGGRVWLEFHTPGSESPRYSLHAVDRPETKPKFAIFIVPQGRETEFLFGSDEGRKQLAESAGFQRLIVVRLDRHHRYADFDEIKSELSDKVVQFAPSDFVKGEPIPFLAVGDGIGTRNVVCRGESQLSGDYVVEDVIGDDGETFRRLIFLKTSDLVQSEARLMHAPRQSNKKKRTTKADPAIDHSFLACEHHKALIGCLAMLPNLDWKKGLVVGVGGGSVPSFIRRHVPGAGLDSVELDAEVINVAERWFEFRHDETNVVHVADGLDFVCEKASRNENSGRYDFIILDVDSKDLSKGLSCPPEPFVEEAFLEKLRFLLKDAGILATTIVSRNRTLRDVVVGKIRNVFDHVFSKDFSGELNEVVYAAAVSSDQGVYTSYYNDIQRCGKKFKKKLAKLDALVRQESPATNVDFSLMFSGGLTRV